MYQKKSQLEHILLRPDTYIGSVEKQTASMWVHAAADTPGGPPKIEQRTISYVPGLYKIFDEILVNAADNKVRDPSMTCVRVDVDPVAGVVRVFNDGDGIPVEVHKEEQVYVPELIFGHLLTSSNYDDTEKKVRNGQTHPQSCRFEPHCSRDTALTLCARARLSGCRRTQRIWRQAGQYLQHRVRYRDLRRQAGAPLSPGVPPQHVRQGGACHHRLQGE